MVDLFIQHGANVNYISEEDGKTPLMVAASQGNLIFLTNIRNEILWQG